MILNGFSKFGSCYIKNNNSNGIISKNLGTNSFEIAQKRGGQVTILKHHPPTGANRILDHAKRDGSLALAQRDRVDLVAHAELFGELVEVHERIDARREDEYERRVGLGVFVGVGERERGRLGEFGAELFGDETLHGRDHEIGSENAQDD